MKKFRLIGGGVVLVLALLVATLVAIFGAGGSASAQSGEDTVDFSQVTRIHLQINEDDTCWGLAATYLGNGLRCVELVEANSNQLQWADGSDIGLVAGRFQWLPDSWIVPFLESERENRTHFFIIYVRSDTDLGGLGTEEPPTESFVDSDPIFIGNLDGTFQHSPKPHHDCFKWSPADPFCDGGTKTVRVILVLIVVVGVVFLGYRLRHYFRWPF